MPLDLRQNRGPIDEMDPTFRDVLEELQGNIIIGHGRNHAVHFFLNFNNDKIDKAKDWLSKFANQYITSAWGQVVQANKYREHGIDGGVFGHLALTAQGYRALGIPEEKIPQGVDPQNRRNLPAGQDLDFEKGEYSDVFREGMASRQKFLAEPMGGRL